MGVIGSVLKANVRVDDEQSTENGVGDWVQRAGGERSDGQWDEACRDDSGVMLAL